MRLTIDDVIDHDGPQVFIRLGDPGLGPPNPFAAMLTETAANRATMNTAANPPACGCSRRTRRPAPLDPGALVHQSRAPGAAATQTRTATFRQLLLQARAGS